MGGAWQILVCASLIFVALVTPVQAEFWRLGVNLWQQKSHLSRDFFIEAIIRKPKQIGFSATGRI